MSKESAEERRDRVREWIKTRVASKGIPWTPMRKPLDRCRVALVSTGGLYLPHQEAFNAESPDGDWSFREIPNDVSLGDLLIAHEHYDHSGAETDMNVIFPLERFRELESHRTIGELAGTHYAFMGFIPDPVSLVEETAPEVARRLSADGVDVVFLFPT
jgi:D-proline reductase (dithiol) PrdB